MEALKTGFVVWPRFFCFVNSQVKQEGPEAPGRSPQALGSSPEAYDLVIHYRINSHSLNMNKKQMIKNMT